MKSFVFGLLALPVIVSCNNDDAPLAGIADREIALGLSLDKRISSRASISEDVLDAENYIIKGEYAIIMELDAYKNRPHCCRFGTSVLDNGRRGNIYPVTDGTPAAAPLKWSNISPVTSFGFTIDNLGYTEACAYDDVSGFLGKEWSETEKTQTYAAQKEQYDADGTPVHTNDIIWGRGTALYGREGKDVSYVELTHRMTRVNVAFVNLTKDQQNDMIVKLTNLVCEPESFNRADGTVSIGDNLVRKEYVLKGQGEELNVVRDETAEGTYLEHVTANHILPPQALTKEHWPEIVVTYTDETKNTREVRGLIPHDILNEDGNTWEALDGLNAGNHLTIVAEINEEIPDIVFTAKVRKWVNLGPVTVGASKDEGNPGIRSMKELERCIELYNDLQQFNGPGVWDYVYQSQKRLKHFGELMQYGDCKVVEVGKDKVVAWTFYIDFPLTELPQTGFRYMLCQLADKHGDWLFPWTYPLTLVDNAGSPVDVDRLKGERGIYNIEDLNHMIKAFNEVNKDGFMAFYGDVNADAFTCTINICDNISGSLICKLDYTGWENIYGSKPKIILNTRGFTLNGNENIGELIGIQ